MIDSKFQTTSTEIRSEDQTNNQEPSDLFEITPLNDRVFAITLSDDSSETANREELFRVLSTALNSHLKGKNKVARQVSMIERILDLLKQFCIWTKKNAWDIFLFRLFDCIIVVVVLFLMKKILPVKLTRMLEWFIDPMDEGFPFSKNSN